MWQEVVGFATPLLTQTCSGIYAVLQWKLSKTDEILTVCFSIPYGKFFISISVFLVFLQIIYSLDFTYHVNYAAVGIFNGLVRSSSNHTIIFNGKQLY